MVTSFQRLLHLQNTNSKLKVSILNNYTKIVMITLTTSCVITIILTTSEHNVTLANYKPVFQIFNYFLAITSSQRSTR